MPRASRDARHSRRRRGSRDVRAEVLRLGGRHGERYYQELMRAADAFARDREREAIRLLRPLRDALPDAASVHELLGLAQYRAGRYPAATRELEAFVNLTGSVEQHPVLMDCYRAQRRWRKVDERWRELIAASPGPELVTEGRIVAAGALADRGRVEEALTLLGRRERPVAKPRDHHLRLWYALGDLEERAGNIPRARALFDRIRRHDAGFADVAERLAALG
jgi:tetratricopeptide (TPR) repeat protein